MWFSYVNEHQHAGQYVLEYYKTYCTVWDQWSVLCAVEYRTSLSKKTLALNASCQLCSTITCHACALWIQMRQFIFCVPSLRIWFSHGIVCRSSMEQEWVWLLDRDRFWYLMWIWEGTMIMMWFLQRSDVGISSFFLRGGMTWGQGLGICVFRGSLVMRIGFENGECLVVQISGSLVFFIGWKACLSFCIAFLGKGLICSTRDVNMCVMAITEWRMLRPLFSINRYGMRRFTILHFTAQMNSTM